MKKLLIALAVGTAMVVPQMPASAVRCLHVNPPEVHIPECVTEGEKPIRGGCRFAAVTDVVAGQGQMTGEMDIAAIVYSVTSPAENPVSAQVKCCIRVNFVVQPGACVWAFGTVLVVGGGVITYTSNSASDFVQLCQDVDYSGSTPDTSECFEASTFEIPPPIVWEIVDPPVCLVLAAHAGTYEHAGHTGYINSQGDVWIDGEGVYDCPPYGNVFGFPPNG